MRSASKNVHGESNANTATWNYLTTSNTFGNQTSPGCLEYQGFSSNDKPGSESPAAPMARSSHHPGFWFHWQTFTYLPVLGSFVNSFGHYHGCGHGPIHWLVQCRHGHVESRLQRWAAVVCLSTADSTSN
jgi:hypothetical protein